MKISVLVILGIIVFSSCKRERANVFSDSRDDLKYTYLEKDSVLWMGENLKYLDNEIYGKEAWLWKSTGSDYREASENLAIQPGVLYSFDAANELCPENWRIASIAEWESLIGSYNNENDGMPHLRDFNLRFDGHVMEEGVFCIYEGDTFWTSDTISATSSWAIALTIDYEGQIQHSFEEANRNNAFYVRCIKVLKNTH